MNKHHQFLFAIFSTCLVILLGLSTVNQTIHDSLFHSNSITDNNSNPSGCMGHPQGECDKSESSQNTEECDSPSCPVNIFSNGVLALDYAPEIFSKSLIKRAVILEYFISHQIQEEKKSHLVRGPPAYTFI